MALAFYPTATNMAGSRHLEAVRAKFATATRRLSTGRRVERAADDAAGSALASRFEVRVAGWRRAQRNVQDGLSAALVADGALSQLSELLTRMRELAVRSANGTTSDSARAAMQAEVDQLRHHAAQTIQSTRFNGVQLLGGIDHQDPPVVDVLGAAGALFGTTTFDGVLLNGTPGVLGADPAGASGTLQTKSGVYEVVATAVPVPGQVMGEAFAIPAGGPNPAIVLTVTGSLGTASVNLAPGSTPSDWATDINAVSASTGVTASIQQPFGPPSDYLVLTTSAPNGAAQTVTVSAVAADPLVAPEDYTGFGPAPSTNTGTAMQATINGVLATVGTSATGTTLTVDSPGNSADGLTITLSDPLDGGYSAGPFPLSAGFVNVQGFAVEEGDVAVTLHGGPESTDQVLLGLSPVAVGAMDLRTVAGSGTIGTLSVATQQDALTALDTTLAALEQVAGVQSDVGAAAANLERQLGLAAATSDLALAARSRIVDADVAHEISEFVRVQLAGQVGVAALAHLQRSATDVLNLVQQAAFGAAPPQEILGAAA